MSITNLTKDKSSRTAIFKITVGEHEFDIQAHNLTDAIDFVIQELTYQQVLGHPALGWKSEFDIRVECLGSKDPD
jgi:hypothetical protein